MSWQTLEQMLGIRGWDRLTSANTPKDGNWIALKAKNAEAVYGAGCAVKYGDPPAEGDVIDLGDPDTGHFTTVNLSSGVVYAYRMEYPTT